MVVETSFSVGRKMLSRFLESFGALLGDIYPNASNNCNLARFPGHSVPFSDTLPYLSFIYSLWSVCNHRYFIWTEVVKNTCERYCKLTTLCELPGLCSGWHGAKIQLYLEVSASCWRWEKSHIPPHYSRKICLQWRCGPSHGFDPWVGKIPWRRKWLTTPVFLPGKFHGPGSLGVIVHGVAKSLTHNWATKHTHNVFKNSNSLLLLLLYYPDMQRIKRQWRFYCIFPQLIMYVSLKVTTFPLSLS